MLRDDNRHATTPNVKPWSPVERQSLAMLEAERRGERRGFWLGWWTGVLAGTLIGAAGPVLALWITR